MVVQTTPPQLPYLAASSQGPPLPLFKVGIVDHALPFQQFLLPGCYYSSISYFCCAFSSSNYQMQDPPLFATSALFLSNLSILLYNHHLYVENSQIDNVASDTFPSCVLHF